MFKPIMSCAQAPWIYDSTLYTQLSYYGRYAWARFMDSKKLGRQKGKGESRRLLVGVIDGNLNSSARLISKVRDILP